MNLFVRESDTVKTSTLVDTETKIPRVLLKPNKSIILNNDLFGQTEDERKKYYTDLLQKYDTASKKPTVTAVECTWRYWSYDLKTEILKTSRVTNAITGETTYDADLINRNKIRFLLKDWNVVDETGNKVELTFTGTKLTEESFRRVLSLEPTLLQAILTQLDEHLYMAEEEEKN